MSEQDEELLEAGEAVQYLSKKWGIPYNTDNFKMLRTRWKLKPAFRAKNATFWRKSDLDAIPAPKRGRPVQKKTEDHPDGPDDISGTSVGLMSRSGLQPALARVG
jgi:hypothetical protein